MLLLSGCAPSYKPALSDARPNQVANTAARLAPLPASHIDARRFLSSGEIKNAVVAYLDSSRLGHRHEMATLKKIAKEQMRQGLRQPDPMIQLLSIFSISISQSEELIDCLQEALDSPQPEVQVAALRALASFNTDKSARLIQNAMRSNYLGVRIEASFLLADQKRIDAADQIEALMHKCPPQALGLFAHLFAKGGSRHDLTLLAQLMSHESPYVRSSALLNAALFDRRSLEKHLLVALSHTHPLELEAAAFAAGHLRLEKATQDLNRLIQSSSPAVRIAALSALEKLGDKEAFNQICSLAAEGDLFAIQLLKDHPSAEKDLIALLDHPDANVRMSSAVSLLSLKSPAGLDLIVKLFSLPGIGFAEHYLPAHSDRCYIGAQIHSKSIEESPTLIHSTLAFKQYITQLCLQFPDETFLPFIDALIKTKNSESISLAANALAIRGSAECVEKLDHLRKQPGAPWLRMRCALALYNITRDIKYLGEIKSWLFSNIDQAIIELMPYGKGPADLAREFSSSSSHELRPNEASALLIEAWMTLAYSESDAGLDLILDALAQSPFQNRLVLAGLLMKAIQ